MSQGSQRQMRKTQPQSFPLLPYKVSQSVWLHPKAIIAQYSKWALWWETGKSGSSVEMVGVKESFFLSCYLHSFNVPLFFEAKAWRVENQNIYPPDSSLLFTPQFLHDGKQAAFCFTSPVSCPPFLTEQRLHGLTE